MIYFDKFSEIGSSHKENEDYTVIGDEKNPFVIVCDGCSSSENTAIGSRILALSAAEIFKTKAVHIVKDIGIPAIWKAHSIVKLLGLDLSCLDSTLIIAGFNKHMGQINVCMWGDGCLYSKYYGKERTSYVEYSNEMPYYLSYQIDPKRDVDYNNLVSDGMIHKITPRSIDDPLEPTSFTFSINELDYLLLATDGVKSFIENDNSSFSCLLCTIHSGICIFKYDLNTCSLRCQKT